jgi:hypothetical protein
LTDPYNTTLITQKDIIQENEGSMKEIAIFIFGFLCGLVVAIIQMWRNAEYIVSGKQKIREKNRKRGTPIIGLYTGQKKRFITPKEASIIPENQITFQYPRKAELQDKPGLKSVTLYDGCFNAYMTNSKMTKAEAFKQAMVDYPTTFSLYDQKSFYEAMRRRERAQTKKK